MGRYKILADIAYSPNQFESIVKIVSGKNSKEAIMNFKISQIQNGALEIKNIFSKKY